MKKRKIFSVSLSDCRVDTFRAGGKGGQHQNKTETGVRITHLPSGAVGEARDSRSQAQNKVAAFLRMAETAAFTRWVKIEAARRLGRPSPEEIVDDQMQLEHIRTEGKVDGKWTEISNQIVATW